MRQLIKQRNSISDCLFRRLLFSLVLVMFAFGSVAAQSAGLLYGVTNGSASGQPTGFGDVYSFNPSSGEVISLHNFNGADGSATAAGLTFLPDGYFYGVARYGGAMGNGTIFKIKPDGSDFQVIHNFEGGLDGFDPTGGLLAFCDGFLYGSTVEGGAEDKGIFYRIRGDGTSFQKVIDFSGVNSGYSPRAKPTLIGNTIFLTNAQGGLHNQGTIIMIQGDGTYRKVIDFDGPVMGGFPSAALIQATNGLLYSVAAIGGVNNFGTLFRINTDGTGFTKLFDFSGLTGASPLATLVQSSSGALFGTTFGGGGNIPQEAGVLFKINLDGTNFIKLHDFGAPGDGMFPDGGLVENNGVLVGISVLGGADDLGTIYTINPNGSGYQKVYDFTSDLTGQPRYNLVPAVSSNLAGPPEAIQLGNDEALCNFPNRKLVALADTTGYTVTWQDHSHLPFFNVTDFGKYWVSVSNTCGVVSDTILFKKTQAAPIQLGDDEVLCTVPNRKLVALSDTTGYTITWQDHSGLSFFNVTDFGKYWVSVANSCGVVSDTITFKKIQANQSSIPDVITPNNDGANETFILDSGLMGSDMVIINRWGKEVYANTDYQNDWDGGGLSTGVFYYLIRDRCGNEYKGPISILR